MKIYEITSGAITLAIIFVFLTLFKGSANILNGILVTLVLYVHTKRQGEKASLVTFLAFVLMCLLFFKQQFFFAVFYCTLASLLLILSKKRLNWLIRVAVITITAFVGFVCVIRLTDYFLMTRIEEIFLKFSNGNYIMYVGIIAVEGLVVAISLASLTALIDKRLHANKDFTKQL